MKRTNSITLFAFASLMLASCSLSSRTGQSDSSADPMGSSASQSASETTSVLEPSATEATTEQPASDTSSEPAEIKDFYTVTVYQSYHEKGKGWGDPRFDCTIQYARGAVLEMDDNFYRTIKFIYTCKGDGYAHIEQICFDPERKNPVPKNYQVFSDLNIYYGLTG